MKENGLSEVEKRVLTDLGEFIGGRKVILEESDLLLSDEEVIRKIKLS